MSNKWDFSYRTFVRFFQGARNETRLRECSARGKDSPPRRAKKEAARLVSRCSFCSRRRSLGRRLRAPRIIGWCTARPPSARSMPSGYIPLRAPPARWYTGRARPADGRQPHARRVDSMRELDHTSPLEPVGSSATRAGDTHGGRATVATAQRICTLGSKKATHAEW